MSDIYTSDFYARQRDGSLASARIVVPIVLSLFPARSIVDVGCGVGAWASEFARKGVNCCLGMDGDYVDRGMLMIPHERYRACDLGELSDIGAQFDLACSLEVAEHLPPESAERFVCALSKAAPIVLFSAAIPGQGGDNHINEQWPSYWARLFHMHGYVPVDCIRPRIWSDDRVRWWYRQNIVVFCRPDKVPSGYAAEMDFRLLDRVLPGFYEQLVAEREACRGPVRRYDFRRSDYARPLSRMPWWIEREFAKFLCSVGLSRDGEFLWNRANFRRR